VVDATIVVVVDATVVVVAGAAVVVVGATVVVVGATVVVTIMVVVLVLPLQERQADKTPAIRRASPNNMMSLIRPMKPVLVSKPSYRLRVGGPALATIIIRTGK
jgi:hypothetical protein